MLVERLCVFAAFETNLRHERQVDGIAKAKAEGTYKGRKPSIDAAKVWELEAQSLDATAIAKALNINNASIPGRTPGSWLCATSGSARAPRRLR
jgi:DNA invertase Pin-like site-specific DNA recombinase